jgi:hypothetical protein
MKTMRKIHSTALASNQHPWPREMQFFSSKEKKIILPLLLNVICSRDQSCTLKAPGLILEEAASRMLKCQSGHKLINMLKIHAKISNSIGDNGGFKVEAS